MGYKTRYCLDYMGDFIYCCQETESLGYSDFQHLQLPIAEFYPRGTFHASKYYTSTG